MSKLKEKGITLVALVITIILLLILAGITIKTITGENGLFSRTKEATKRYKNVSENEKKDIESIGEYLEKIEEQKDSEGIYIYTEEELKKFRDDVNSGTSYDGKNVYLMRDIDLHGEESNQETWWEPIGKEENAFKGTFEGNNKQITNLYGNYDGSNGNSVGFFGVTEGATIKNIAVLGELKATGTVTEVGGIIGKANGKITIEGCSSNVTITSDRHAGGCIGLIYGNDNIVIVNQFTNTGNITSTGNNGDGGTGGCVGRIDKSIAYLSNIVNKSKKIEGKSITGGIVGLGANNSTLIINNSSNQSEIISTTREAGGIIGDTDSYTYCVNVYNNGSISARKVDSDNARGSSGGIIGSSYYLDKVEIKIINSYNAGKIIADNYACGILGIRNTLINNSYIKNVYSSGMLESSKEKYGILAKNPNITGLKFDTVLNAFYINAENGSNLEIDVGTKKTDGDLKSKEFIDELNKYVTENPTLEIEGIGKINLSKWKTGEDGYPVLEM